MADKASERWDIYDKDRNLTGRTMQRNDWNMKPGDFHITVLAVINTPDGKYFCTRRALTKSYAPGAYEVPGGGVMAGETSLEAVKREVLEETGIVLDETRGGLCFTYMRENPDEGDNYFVDVYKFTMDYEDMDIKLEEEETSGYAFLTLDEIRAIAAENNFLHFKSIERAFVWQ